MISPKTATILGISSLTVMSGAAVAPALPAIRDAYGGGEDAAALARLVLTVPAAVIALTAPLSGRVISRFGWRGPLFAALVLYAAAGSAGLWLPVAWGMAALILTRALLGVATAVVMTIATSLIGAEYEGDERSRVLAGQNIAMAGGGVVFLLLSGLLADASWRGPFGVYLGALAAILAARLFLSGCSDADEERAAETEDTSPFPWGEIAPVWAIAFVGMALFYVVPTQVPFYLEQLGVTSGARAGIAVAFATAGGVVSSPFANRLGKRFGRCRVAALVFAGLGAGFLVAWLAGSGAAALTGPYVVACAGMALIGLSLGLLMPTLSAWVLATGTPTHRVALVGGLTSALFAGQFASPLLGEPIARALETRGLLGVSSVFAGLFFALLLALQGRLGAAGACPSPL